MKCYRNNWLRYAKRNVICKVENQIYRDITSYVWFNNGRIHDRVCKVKLNEEVGVKYMQAWEEKYFEREEGIEIGARMKLLEMVQKKLLKGKTPDIIADELEEEIETILDIIREIEEQKED